MPRPPWARDHSLTGRRSAGGASDPLILENGAVSRNNETVVSTPPRLLAPPAPASLRAASPPTLSVIVATYEVASIVHEAIESLLRQTLPPHEVIVCDDGSSDDIEGALEPFRDRIVFLRKQHGGEASAKNAAAAAASGDFVVILDADDVYFPERLEAIAEAAAARPDLDVITTDAYLEVDGVIVRRCYDGRWRFEIEDQRRELLRRNFVFGLAAVRRELLLRHGGFDEAILWTTDWDCWIRLVLAGSRIGCIDEPLALYRLREDSLSARREEITSGKVMSLEKTRRDPRLTDEERAVVDASIAGYERELAVLAARRSVAGADEDARSRALAVATGRGFGWRTRLEAGLMAAAPRRAGRRLRRREQDSWVGAGGVRVKRASTGDRNDPAVRVRP
jgi:GT2 family glycosyltransferase